MSGSRRWFEYTADDNALFAIELDESNAESNISGTRLCADLVAGTGLLPARARPRYVNTVLSTDSLQRRRFVVGEAGLFATIAPGDVVADDGASWQILSKVGERFTFPKLTDSGLLDGDAPN